MSGAVAIIQDKLDRVKRYITDRYAVNGRLEPDEQYAVRLVESRKRELQRALLVSARAADDPERLMAEAEMRCTRRDVGEVFRWGYKNHGYGRLGCPGCEFDYRYVDGMPMPVKVVTAAICPVCLKGVMHSQLVESSQEARSGADAFLGATGLPKGQESPYEAHLGLTGGILLACESCGHMELGPCS